MNIIRYPEKSSWTKLLQRPLFDLSSLYEKVRAILDDVKQNGDEALIKYEELFDHIKLNDLAVQPEELEEAGKELKPDLKTAIQSALEHIKKFHEAQKFAPIRVETAPGVICEQRSVPISKVGLYIPADPHHYFLLYSCWLRPHILQAANPSSYAPPQIKKERLMMQSFLQPN